MGIGRTKTGFRILIGQSLRNGHKLAMTIENLLNFISDFDAEHGRPPTSLKISEAGFEELANSVDSGKHPWTGSFRSINGKTLKKVKLFGVEVCTYADTKELCEAQQ